MIIEDKEEFTNMYLHRNDDKPVSRQKIWHTITKKLRETFVH